MKNTVVYPVIFSFALSCAGISYAHGPIEDSAESTIPYYGPPGGPDRVPLPDRAQPEESANEEPDPSENEGEITNPDDSTTAAVTDPDSTKVTTVTHTKTTTTKTYTLPDGTTVNTITVIWKYDDGTTIRKTYYPDGRSLRCHNTGRNTHCILCDENLDCKQVK